MREQSIFIEALEKNDPAERAAFLDQACAAEPTLRPRIERLLRHHHQADDVLDRPSPWAVDPVGQPIAEAPGTMIGPYRLMEQIGEGGMGVVHVAEQSQPVRRKVALKVIKPGMDTKQVIARFEAERQALAMMDHPNIARIFDGGVTESGRPYFVMELVRGVPITEYCDGERLPVRARLELFVLVCRAVQHAHQKGIIHRDLKPSNILVTLHDGVPVPKVIDFGVAKATGQALTEKTIYTGFAQLVGTPLYMSPEQAELSGLDVDTRSDIYSLGVLLYELLTGTTPFDRDTFLGAAFDEMRRIIREHEPPKPSARLSTLGDDRRTGVTSRRDTDPRQLGRAVRGDLDWIVMRALEKDRRRRYETANDFAADVVRHLDGLPVDACPPSASYRLAKYSRRHRATLVTAALIGLALLAGTAVSVWQARRARDAASQATARADETKQVVDYLVKDVFGAAVPGKGRSRAVTVGELLDQANATVGARFRRQPLVEASVRMALARTYRDQVDGARALPHAVRATEIRARYLGPVHPGTLEALAEQARAYHPVLPPESVRDEYLANVRRVFEAHRRVLGPAHPETLELQVLLAAFLDRSERFDEARPEAVAAEARAVHALGPDHPVTLEATCMLGWTALHQGDAERAEALMRRSFEGYERILGPLHPDTLGTLNNLGLLEENLGRPDKALPFRLEHLRRTRAVNGIYDKILSALIRQLCVLFRQAREFVALRDFCEGELRELLAMPRELDAYLRTRRLDILESLISQLSTLPESIGFDGALVLRAAQEHIELGGGADDSLNRFAWMLVSRPRLRAVRPSLAVQMAERAIKFVPDRATVWNTLGVAHYRAGNWKAAIEALEKSESLDPGKSLAFNAFFLAMTHWQLGHQDEARTRYDQAVEWMEKHLPRDEELRRFRGEAERLLKDRPAKRIGPESTR